MDDVESIALGECSDGHMILILNGVGFHFGEREENALVSLLVARACSQLAAAGGDVESLSRVVAEEAMRQITSKKGH